VRGVKAIDWNRHENNIYYKIEEWFKVICEVIQDPNILLENAYNMDETGVMLSKLSSVNVLVGKDDLCDDRGTGVKRTMVTAIECISADGRSLLPLIIWPALTHWSNWTIYPTPGWHYAHSENGYNDSKISLEWLTRVFDPQTKDRANGKPRVLICDGFGTHETLEVLEFCFENNIILCCLPSHTSHKLQPCDVGPFAPLKTAYRDQVERLNRGGVDRIGKEHFTSLYSPAREKALSKRNISAGWAATGLFPFNPERVFRHTPRPLDVTTVLEVAEVVTSILQDEEPQTPITPVTTEALASLHNLIKQDTSGPYDRSTQRIQRHVQKLASAAKISFAECALLRDQNQFLSEINKEAKVRRSTRSLVLGKAKVMSYEDLEVARENRAAKDEVTADKGKGKGSRKRNCAAPEAAEPSAKVVRTSTVRKAAKDKDSVVPWMAPVARTC
jgi:hypothetical protein